MLFLQAFDILKEAVSLSDAVLHDVQSVSTLSEVREFKMTAGITSGVYFHLSGNNHMSSSLYKLRENFSKTASHLVNS